MASTIPPSAPLPSNVSPPGPEQYYLRFGNEVRTLPLHEMRRGFQAGEITTETWICKVGDSEWRKIADATSLDLGPAPELQSVTNVYERPIPAAPVGVNPKLSPLKRAWYRAIGQENRWILAVWVLIGTLSLALVLQRSGALFVAFGWIGQEKQYEALELDLLGGPGNGTVRSAEKLWLESIPDGKFPFSEAAKRDAGVDKKTKN